MFVKVIFPFSKSSTASDFSSSIVLKKGDIVVVKQNNKEKIGVVSFIENRIPPFDKLKGIVIRKADSLDRFDFWREFEKVLLKEGVNMTFDAYQQYQLTKGNFNTPLDVAKKKLTRNLLLAHKPDRLFITNDESIILQYGALRMYYRKGNIHNIKNRTKFSSNWIKNEIGYTYYSKLLGIEGL